MARRTTPAPVPERPKLTPEQTRRGIARLEQRIVELKALDISKVHERHNSPEVEQVETAVDETLSQIFGHSTVPYNRYSSATRLDNGPLVIGMRASRNEAQKYLREGIDRAVALLGQAIKGLNEELEDNEAASEAVQTLRTEVAKNNVFVVHGRDEGPKQSVARFLEKIGLKAIILQEQPDRGFTVIEKFEAHAREVAFAVVLLTPDDVGGLAGTGDPAARARQNVIFELGYFVGKLGRGRACLLKRGPVEIPSDLAGVIYSEYDDGGAWKLKLAQELKVAGLEFDANKVFGA